LLVFRANELSLGHNDSQPQRWSVIAELEPEKKALDPDLPELEQEFRQNWCDYRPATYAGFLGRTDGGSRIELLVRMLSAELEFYFQPPTQVIQRVSAQPQPLHADDDDERVRPCIQLFTLRFPELLEQQEQMLRLIVLEYALRLRYDPSPPNAESYFELVPDFSNRLNGLLELTESKIYGVRAEPSLGQPVEKGDSTIRESEAAGSLALAPLPCNLGCFLLVRLIGRGGMGYVHAAIDLRSTAQVAVKVMRRVDAWSVYRFIEEFSWLSQLNHPNLVRLYDAFSDGDIRYFSMELVEGRTIRDWFRRLPNTSDNRWSGFRKVLAQLASAIQFLHQRGVIHRDVKCSNVMITPRRRAVLLDLGLAMRHDDLLTPPSSMEGQRLVGTLQYMAPEGLTGAPMTTASDWYSFGVVLYEVMLDAYPPIELDREALDPRDRYRVNEAELHARLADCPRDLANLCVALLQPQPQHRPLGTDILRALGQPSTTAAPSSNTQEILGREEELANLNALLRGVENLGCGLNVVRGVSGIGKTALIQLWIAQVDLSTYQVFSLRCFRQDHTPLRLLNMLVQAIVQSLAGVPQRVWGDSLAENAKLIARTFPQIQQVVPDAPQRELSEFDPTNAVARRDASLRALLALLTTLSQYKPIVIVVDDAHWADPDSLKALCQLANHEAFAGTIVWVDSANQQGVVNCVLDAQFSTQPDILPLEPLPESVCQQLLRKWATAAGTRLSPAVLSDLIHRSEGNPFLLLELFRAFQSAACDIGFTEELWLGTDTQETSLRRIGTLPIQAENVLQYLAVADQPIGFHQLQMVSRIAPHELQRTLSYLSAQGWIRNRGEDLDSEVEVSNEKFRKLVAESLPAERLHRRHFRMARILSSETPPPWSRIAHHYWHANKKREAAACYMEAARVAAGASAFEEALFFLNRAFLKEADRSPQEQFNARRLKANCLDGMGSSVDAAKLYEELRAETEDASEATLIECLAGEQWIRAGQLDKGLSLLRGALSELGFAHTKKSWWTLWAFRWRSLMLGFQGPTPPPETQSLPAFSLLEQCLTRVSTPLTFLDNQLGPELILRLDAIATQHGSIFEQAQVLVRSGIILSLGGRRWRKQALERLRLGRSLARASKMANSQATAYFCMYVWFIQRGAHCKARIYAEKALALYAQGHEHVQWEIQFLHWSILTCYWNTNLLHTLQQSTARLRASAQHRADSMSLYWMNVNAAIWSDLSEHKVEQARTALDIADRAIANQPFQSPRFYLWLSRILLAVYREDWKQAQALLAQDWSKLANSLVLRSKHSMWLALSARICADLVSHRLDPQTQGTTSGRWLRDARRSVKHMLAMDERVFAAIGKAFQLVVEAAAGKVAEPSTWKSHIAQLHHVNHQLLGLALQWHASLHAHPSESAQLQQATEQALREAGCAQPRLLLNIVLPLPHSPTRD